MRPHVLTILGATGSIGVSTLDVVAAHPGKYRIFALTAHRNMTRLAELCLRFNPDYAVVATSEQACQLRIDLAQGSARTTEVLHGPSALEAVSADPAVDSVMAAIVGGAGLPATLAAARAGKRLLLANKEALVMAGALLIETAQRSGAVLLPVDSEHNAIFQCLPHPAGQDLAASGVDHILLTASGGPFLHTALTELEKVTPEQACKHPRWSMGRKISVDSATMMNKGLELIEACWLFGARPEQVEIVIHPQSLVHSLVAYRDGSLLAQLGHTDMRIPIAHALSYPLRQDSGVPPLDLTQIARLEFYPLDPVRFPAVALARQAMVQGGAAAVVLNAANEVAVAAFLENRIRFTDIIPIVDHALSSTPFTPLQDIEAVMVEDHRARLLSRSLVDRIPS